MSLCYSGLSSDVKGGSVTILVANTHPLVKLAVVIPWEKLAEMIIPDLQKTTRKGFLNRGRYLTLRIHLGALLLQMLYNMTDRETEYDIKDNAASQIFCGIGEVNRWNCPDHTKIEEFRNRLSPETKRQISNFLAVLAVDLGFGNPEKTEIDSTVQEANASYPADSSLMTKLSKKCHSILKWLKRNGNQESQKINIDLKKIMTKAKEYFFMAKNTAIEKKRQVFSEVHKEVKKQTYPLLNLLESLDEETVAQMPWNCRKIFDQIATRGKRYLLDVAHFIRTYKMKPGKLLAWHLEDITCIKKGKSGKEKEFGRTFQLGRIGGNFIYAGKSSTVRMEDAASLLPMIGEHSKLFGENKLVSLCTDKLYFSYENIGKLDQVKDLCLGFQMEDMSEEKFNNLRDHRAGLEALIGHIKHGGQLGKSRMKSDKTTLGAGYTAIGGFNLRQIIRHQKGKMKKAS